MENFRIIRRGGLGDELCITPAVRTLKKAMPNAHIVVDGFYAHEIYKHSSYADAIEHDVDPGSDYTTHDVMWHNGIGWGYDLHLVDFYAQQIGVQADSLEIDLNVGEEDDEWGQWMDDLPRPLVCFNSYGGWETKSHRLDLVAKILLSQGITVMQIGHHPGYMGVGIDGTEKSGSLLRLGAMLKRCDLFLGCDAGIFHVASAVRTKCVIVFGSTLHHCYIHNPEREFAVYNPVCNGCYNIHADLSVIEGGCMRGDRVCMKIDHKSLAHCVCRLLDIKPNVSRWDMLTNPYMLEVK